MMTISDELKKYFICRWCAGEQSTALATATESTLQVCDPSKWLQYCVAFGWKKSDCETIWVVQIQNKLFKMCRF